MNKVVCCFLLLGFITAGFAKVPTSYVPFTYVINYEENQAIKPEFRDNFVNGAPTLFHPGSGLRYLGRFGFGSTVMDNRHTPYGMYKKQIQDYLEFLHEKDVRWITPYLCNQTISGNYDKRFGAWEVIDNWEDYFFLNYGPKPSDPINWMQREPSGNLHYNYKRKCFLERHEDDLQIRYAPCPNHPDWRQFMNNEARHAAEIGFNGLFIDNNIIHCYCESCEARFQQYLKKKYTPDEFEKAFGTMDYSKIMLYKEGDYRYWARSFSEFIPWLEGKYTPEQRRIFFDTLGPLADINVDAAGGGMLFGESEAFIKEHVLPKNIKASYENIRLANPALQTAVGRLRWAETVMFWASSIGDQLAEMTAAGREKNNDFFLIPNWGVRQRVLGASGRAEDGKDMRRWRKGASWQMYEEDSATGIIAPGVVLDYDMELRYAFACDVRAMLLPYTLNDTAVEEVHHAEVAASGSSVFVTSFRNPDVREKYRHFFENHSDLFDGYCSAAKVALAHFFDQTHCVNIEHLREIDALNRYLCDQHIPFDHIIETDVTSDRLDDYKVIILANIEFMSDEQVDVIQNFINSGGTVILIGDNAIFNLFCQVREKTSVFISREGDPDSVIRFASLETALPYRGIYLSTALQASRGKLFSLNFEGTRYTLLNELDKKIGIKRYQTDGPITDVIEKALNRSPHLLDPKKASGVRNTVWIKNEKKKKILTVHLVNKNVPLAAAEGKRIFQPVKDLMLSIPCESGEDVKKVLFWQPGRKQQTLELREVKNRQVNVLLPELKSYGIVEVLF